MNEASSKFERPRRVRPYFFFQRRGQVIPAGGHGDDAPGPSRYADRRGRRGAGRSRGGRDYDAVLDSSLLQPQYYAAPNDDSDVMSYAVLSPQPFPGWQLYLHKEVYQPESDLVKRIKLVETFYTKNLIQFDLNEIKRSRYFRLKSALLKSDEGVLKDWPTFANDLESSPQRVLAILGLAMYSLINAVASAADLEPAECTKTQYVPRISEPDKIYARIVDFEDPRKICDMTNNRLDTLYCVRCIVTAMGDVDACASWIAYKCPRCGQEQTLKQTGAYASVPYCCKRTGCLAKKGFIECRSSVHTRITPKQIIRVAESNVQATAEEAFQFLDVELRYDLVNAVIPGQELLVVGILKMRPLVKNCLQYNETMPIENACEIFLKGVAVVDAKSVKHNFSERDFDTIAMINSEADSFKLLVHSVAPQLHGHEISKAGVLLSLFGGAGSQLQEDNEINVLIVGDPGSGKSHLLQMCAEISPKCSLVSGKRGCTVGNQLAATIKGRNAITIDAGALANSQNGHCCIDDLDHLSTKQDFIAQVLQSKTISLPFSHVFATIKTPTAIIASVNSARGHYDQSKPLSENIRITSSLLNEFHLVHLILDKPNKDMDTSLTEHIKALHAGLKKGSNIAARFAMKPKTNNSIATSEQGEDKIDDNYDLTNRLRLHFNGVDEEQLDLLPSILLKKFITCARQQVRPLLKNEAVAAIRKFYLELRQQQLDEKVRAITTSHLEALIRLTQARARVDFSAEATHLHVRDVVSIMRNCLADITEGDYVDLNPATTAVANKRGATKNFIQMLQMSSRRILDMDELKELAKRAGITTDIRPIVDAINLQGYLLKKGPNLYEVMND